jgi:hypothetical protein
MKEDGSCTQSLVQTARRKPKFRSSLMAAGPFTVRNAFGNIGRKDIRRGMHRNPAMVFFYYCLDLNEYSKPLCMRFI